jgi:hypothetical protein
VEDDDEVLSNGAVEVVNRHVDKILEHLLRAKSAGVLISLDDIAAELLAGKGKRDTYAVMLAVALQRLVWRSR